MGSCSKSLWRLFLDTWGAASLYRTMPDYDSYRIIKIPAVKWNLRGRKKKAFSQLFSAEVFTPGMYRGYHEFHLKRKWFPLIGLTFPQMNKLHWGGEKCPEQVLYVNCFYKCFWALLLTTCKELDLPSSRIYKFSIEKTLVLHVHSARCNTDRVLHFL